MLHIQCDNKDFSISNIEATHLYKGCHNGVLGNNAAFNQPSGVAVLGGAMIFVADTNNHAIRLINLEDHQLQSEDKSYQQKSLRLRPNMICSTLELKNLKALGFPATEYRPFLSNHLELFNLYHGADRTIAAEGSNPHLKRSLLGFGRVVQVPLEMSLGIDLISLDIKLPSPINTGDAEDSNQDNENSEYEFACPVEVFNVRSNGPWICYR